MRSIFRMQALPGGRTEHPVHSIFAKSEMPRREWHKRRAVARRSNALRALRSDAKSPKHSVSGEPRLAGNVASDTTGSASGRNCHVKRFACRDVVPFADTVP